MLRAFFSGNRQIKKLPILLHGLWLLTILASVWINHTYSQREMEQIARTEAKTIVQRDLALRRWAALRGGVYVPISAQTPPNPYLAHIPDRDIKKPDGTPLTLINPAYLVRLVAESSNGKGNAIAHMTSLKPLRPENRPDSWEKAALERAELGEKEISEFTTIDGKPYLRYLHAVATEAPCLKCHASQGYQLGDLRGGLTVSLPTGILLAGHDQALHALHLWHLLIYLLGAAGLFWGQGLVARRIRERNQVVAALEESEANFRTVADFAHAWEYWMAPDGSMKYVSPSVQRVTGYPPQLFLADPEFIKSIIVGDADALVENQLDNDLQHKFTETDFQIRTSTGEIRWLHHICQPIHDRSGGFLGRRASNYDITEEKTAKLHNEELIDKLREALEKVKTLRGFLPICAGCKKIRDDQGYWSQVESYIASHSEAVFSHGICPDCAHRLYPEYYPPPDEGPTSKTDPTDPPAK
jgi:PAS domain S-box-containing protein